MKARYTSLLITLMIASHSSAECLSREEKQNLLSDPYYLHLNYVQCDDQRTELDKFVCSKPSYLLMFKYFTVADKDAIQRYFNKNYNYQEARKSALSDFSLNNINPNHLCFDLKQFTRIRMNGASPYMFATEKEFADYVIQENKHGAVLTNRDGYKIYMGKDCDATDSKNQQGYWYKEKNQYTIEVGQEKVTLEYSDINLEDYQCIKK